MQTAKQAHLYSTLRQSLSVGLVPSSELAPHTTLLVSRLRARSLAEGGEGGFLSLQARVEADMATWCPPVYCSQGVPSISRIKSFLLSPLVQSHSARLGRRPVMYVACALRGEALAAAMLPLRANFTVVTKYDLMAEFDHALPHRELAAVVERHVLAQADVFVGCAISSLSHYVKERVLLSRRVALDYMAPAACQNRMCSWDFESHQGTWMAFSSEGANSMHTPATPELSHLVNSVDAANRVTRLCLEAEAKASLPPHLSESSREDSITSLKQQLLPQGGRNRSDETGTQPWALPWSVQEIPRINAFLATSVCLRHGAFYGGKGAFSAVRDVSNLHLCNRSRRFELEQAAPSGVWDSQLAAVLPCSSRRSLLDWPEKYCRSFWRMVTSRDSSGTRKDDHVIPGLALVLGESHDGNIWHFVRELFFAYDMARVARQAGIKISAILLRAVDATSTASRSPAGSMSNRSVVRGKQMHGRIQLKSIWQRQSLKAVLEDALADEAAQVKWHTLEAQDGRCFSSVAGKLTRSFSMNPETGRGVRKAVLASCGLHSEQSHLVRRSILLVLRNHTRQIYNAGAVAAMLHRWAAPGMLCDRDLELQIVNTGSMPFCAQVAAFSAAKLVIGFSGADLTNAIFMQDDALLLELFTINFYATAYSRAVPLDTIAVDSTDMNDFSSYLSRLNRLYLQGHVTIARSADASDPDRACDSHARYYYDPKCVHLVQLVRLREMLFRARAMLAMHGYR